MEPAHDPRAASDLRRRSTLAAFLDRGIPLALSLRHHVAEFHPRNTSGLRLEAAVPTCGLPRSRHTTPLAAHCATPVAAYHPRRASGLRFEAAFHTCSPPRSLALQAYHSLSACATDDVREPVRVDAREPLSREDVEPKSRVVLTAPSRTTC